MKVQIAKLGKSGSLAKNFVLWDDLSESKQRRIRRKVRRMVGRKFRGNPESLAVLRDDEAFEDLCAEVWEQFGRSPAAVEFGDGQFLDQVMRFFDWLVNEVDWERIAEIIKIIVGLF